MLCSIVNTNTDTSHLNLILLFGVIIFGGTFGSRLFQKLRIPQVIGYIAVGVLLGEVFGLITGHTMELLEPFMMFALGAIGFMIGGELRADIFKKYGRQFFIILFSEGFGAFFLVGTGTAIVMWFIHHNIALSIAAGLIFGAISSATAPAATVNVLWEYKTRGPLTAAILAIVALDDGLALLLYRVAATGAQALTGGAGKSALSTAVSLAGEIFGAIALGIAAGAVLYFVLKFIRDDDKILAFSIATLLLVVGVSIVVEMDPILPAMTLGVTIANMAPRRSKGLFELVKKFSPPIYVAFFVLAGAHLEFSKLAVPVVVLIVVYVLCRIVGKIVGAWVGAGYCNAASSVRKYLGLCLQSQAGVAIGLAILASKQFDTEFGKTVIMVVMTATFITEILGPILVKVGVTKAGEVGMNVTEEDLIKTYIVADVMDKKPTIISQNIPLQEILDIFSKSDSIYYPVVDENSKITGKITIAGIKELFANQDVAGWLLACDVAEPVRDKTIAEKPLEDAIERMRRYDLESIPVVADEKSNKLVGVLDYHKTLRKISTEVLHRRKTADGMVLATG